jgi:uncharacterized membrane protein YGL010W
MRSLDQWLNEYSDSHRNPTNKLLHYLCVPPIQLALMGLLLAVPVPAALGGWTQLVNWASLSVLAGLVYYAVLSPRLAFGMLLVVLGGFALLAALARLSVPLWETCLAIFVIAWIGQFVGHAIEGKRPSFFKDLQFLLIGPLWILSAMFRRLGLRY